ncbi:hypothetical protein SAMN04488066_11026 [Halorubrum aquaticum]|uniref:Uncharacterized protein n=1 Tax=Halorubrum aquaticum TaxID=387340 RepID=A0A1I3B7J5_9EURY|nr:hypothetical protein [Halorubrum aquaticum]SFH58056.1 hypothetical protein SAMN04488066_11026 [Halorubrum aquaticum]
MELSRRGVLGGLGAACAVGAVGFAGAASVGGGGSDGTGDGATAAGEGGDDDPESGGSAEGSNEREATSVAVDPDAPFEGRLLREDGSGDGGSGDDGPGDLLFDAADLDYVQGVTEDEGEHLVGMSLSAEGEASFRERLEASGAVDEPGPFAVSMTLDGEEVRRVDLDEPTVTALTDEEWGGVLTLPFESAGTAESVYGSLAAE